jgi:RNA polymerase sigma factor for flagellar operon FliA
MSKQLRKYKQEQSGVDGRLREQLIQDYAGLVRFVAQRIASRLPSNVDIEDLISSGVIGLMDAIDKYDPTRENKFKTYAEFRIRGSILDELRGQDWVPRSARDKAKMIERATQELEQLLGRKPLDDEVATHMGLSIEDFQDLENKVNNTVLLSIDELGGPSQGDRKSLMDSIENVNSKNPFTQLKNQASSNILKKNIEELPDKQKLVLQLYYYEELNLKEIGRILEVTESRVSQLHTQAVVKLRSKLKNMLSE